MEENVLNVELAYETFYRMFVEDSFHFTQVCKETKAFKPLLASPLLAPATQVT